VLEREVLEAMRLSNRECLRLYYKFNNPYIRRLTDDEYNKLAEKYPKIKRHIARQKELAERMNHG
jgi:hypothetical protein